jgi:hypothetical protein
VALAKVKSAPFDEESIYRVSVSTISTLYASALFCMHVQPCIQAFLGRSVLFLRVRCMSVCMLHVRVLSQTSALSLAPVQLGLHVSGLRCNVRCTQERWRGMTDLPTNVGTAVYLLMLDSRL